MRHSTHAYCAITTLHSEHSDDKQSRCLRSLWLTREHFRHCALVNFGVRMQRLLPTRPALSGPECGVGGWQRPVNAMSAHQQQTVDHNITLLLAEWTVVRRT